MDDHEARIAKLESLMKEVCDSRWRLTGRLCALEIIATQAIFDHATAAAPGNPFDWVQRYLKVMEATSKGLVSDVDDQSKAPRHKAETVNAIDEFLEELVLRSAGLKGSPRN